jgi:thioredoxin-like negative regulator of GroEL
MSSGEKVKKVSEHPKCDLGILKGFIEHEGNVLLVAGKQECPNCRAFEAGGLANFLAESHEDFALGQVNMDDVDPKCQEIVTHFDLKSAPTVIAFRNGVEVDRLVPTLDAEKDADALRKMAEKIKRET